MLVYVFLEKVTYCFKVLSFSANKQQQIQIFLVKKNIFHEFSCICILIFVIFCLLSFSHKQWLKEQNFYNDQSAFVEQILSSVWNLPGRITDASDLLQKVLSGEEREETAAFHRLLTSRLGKGHCLGQPSPISLAD